MWLTLNALALLTLGLLSIADGHLVIECSTFFLLEAMCDNESLSKRRNIFIPLPHKIRNLHVLELDKENVSKYFSTLNVVVDPERSKNPAVKAMAGIAPRPSNAGEVFIPNPTLVGGMLKVTICIAKTYKSSLPEGSTVVAEPGQCTMATVTLPASELQGGPNGYTYGSLQFVFHKNIASQVEALLHPVEETQPPTTPFLAPPPILLDGDEPSTWSCADG